jgi:hypothetical protein
MPKRKSKSPDAVEPCPHGHDPAWCLRCQEATLPQCAGCDRHAVLNFHCSRCGVRFCSRYCMETIHPWSGCRESRACPVEDNVEMARRLRG